MNSGICPNPSQQTALPIPVRPRRRKTALNSFSLVEVIIALAIVSFVLVSLLGLMAYASQLVHQADQYSRLSSVSSQVLAIFNRQSFTATSNCALYGSNYYFTYDGLPTNNASAYFQCVSTNATSSSSTLTNLMLIQLTITWPKPAYTSTNIIITSSLNYD